MPPQYRMFVDESGDGNLSPYKDDASKFLCLTGIIINLDEADDIKYQMDALKYVHFDIDVFISNYPLHRKELTKCTAPFENLSDVSNHNIFNNAIKSFLMDWNFTIIAVLIDKERVEKVYTKPFHPYRYGFGILMEKFSIFLLDRGTTGDIMCESIGTKEDKKLKETYLSLYQYDFLNFNSQQFRQVLSSRELKMKKKSECIVGLEIADLIAKPMRRYILKCRAKHIFPRETFDDELIEVIEPKIFQKYGRLNGYGIKLFP
jgi:hypothetical protein